MPWNTAAASRYSQVIEPAAIRVPMTRAETAAAPWPACIISLRSTRSAMAPANSTKTSMETPEPASTSPSRKGEPVRS